MATAKQAKSQLHEALDETALGMLRAGLIDRQRYDQLTLREIPESERTIEIPVPSSEDIRAMREKANLSQAVFARRLNLTAGYISQLERGVKKPTGAVVVLLNTIQKRGIDIIS